jgi:hypothetical protein
VQLFKTKAGITKAMLLGHKIKDFVERQATFATKLCFEHTKQASYTTTLLSPLVLPSSEAASVAPLFP